MLFYILVIILIGPCDKYIEKKCKKQEITS